MSSRYAVAGAMTKKLPILAFLALLAPPAQAQQDIDTLYRAAYCVGVLKADLKWQTSPEGTAREREVFSILCSFPRGSCPAQSAEQWMQRHLGKIEARRQRYAAYLLARTGGRPNGVVLGLIDKGEKEGWSDTSNLRETRDTLKRHPVSICWEAAHKVVRGMGATWDEDEQQASIIECVARKDQAYANRMACRSMPDRLPF
jgi:hypothetical protein